MLSPEVSVPCVGCCRDSGKSVLSPPASASVGLAHRRSLKKVFNEYDVQILSPHYEVDPLRPAVVPRAPAAPAAQEDAEPTYPSSRNEAGGSSHDLSPPENTG